MKRIIMLALLLSLIIVKGNGQSTTEKKYQFPEFAGKYNQSMLGRNVFIFSPADDMKEVQAILDTIFKWQSGRGSEFSNNRFAILFRSGKYSLDVKVDYYMQILGLGKSPEDVIIEGAVRSNTTHGNSVLTNFWRGVENLTVVPQENGTMVWGVSQAAPLRRVHIKGNLQLFDKGYASGGFLADSKVDGTITSGPQQQWLTRNSSMGRWEGGNWNMMFIGVPGAPEEDWPAKPYTVISETPVIREKPYLFEEGKKLSIIIPGIKRNSASYGWSAANKPEKIIKLEDIFLAYPFRDDAKAINTELAKGKHVLLTPGRYMLKESIKITKPGTVLMGIGLATLIPENGNAAVEVADVDGVTVSGITIDAGPVQSKELFVMGEPGSSGSHSDNPTFLYDIFIRVGGPAEGSAISSMVINSNDVVIDHTWLWRADHGNGVGWTKNRGANGLVVNGKNVTVYGLFNEHFQEYQTLWNGENGKVYFYQSEMPYDPPTADSWKHGETYGYASYKVADNIKNHEAWGIGIYNVFYNAPVIVDNAMETPESIESRIHNKIIFWLNGNKESYVKSIINGKGGRIDVNTRKQAIK